MTATRAAALVALACASGLGCGGSSGKILERIDGGAPPSSNLRVDVFLVRSVSTCAVGPACASPDPEQCFYVADAAGARTSFDPGGVQFVPPGDPATLGAQPVRCFRLVLDDAGVAMADELTRALRTQVFQASGGDINLDIRLHQVPTIEAGFSAFYTGLFLEPSALSGVALPMVNRETDFVYAVTGSHDPETGLAPRIGPCSGTNWLGQGVIGSSTYTWLALSGNCTQERAFLSTWLIQLYFGLRDVMQAPNLYGGSYPACGQGDPDSTRWFPYLDDCTSDPDYAACGAASCPDQEAFNTHLLARHWPRGEPFNGNHCSDGRMDRDETAIDTGGVCDRIGR